MRAHKKKVLPIAVVDWSPILHSAFLKLKLPCIVPSVFTFSLFRIPMHGFVDSFNVSVAVSISVSKLVPKLTKLLPPEERTIPKSEQKLLLDEWKTSSTAPAQVSHT